MSVFLSGVLWILNADNTTFTQTFQFQLFYVSSPSKAAHVKQNKGYRIIIYCSILTMAATLSENTYVTNFSFYRPVHIVRFFLIATAILLITTNGLYRSKWKCSHFVTATTSPTPIQPIVSKKQIAVAIRKNRTV